MCRQNCTERAKQQALILRGLAYILEERNKQLGRLQAPTEEGGVEQKEPCKEEVAALGRRTRRTNRFRTGGRQVNFELCTDQTQISSAKNSQQNYFNTIR